MPVEISIIVPVFNEADNILPLAREVAQALDKEPRPFELVFVDDASRDGTWEKIQEAHRLDPRVRGVRHERNSGQSAAIWTGVLATNAPIIATLDGDLQNDPADLPRLLAELTPPISSAASGSIAGTTGCGAFLRASRVGRAKRRSARISRTRAAQSGSSGAQRWQASSLSMAGTGSSPFWFMRAESLPKRYRSITVRELQEFPSTACGTVSGAASPT